MGGDGIVVIYPSDVADFKMRMFNIDGSEGKMCGNAVRCIAKYVYDRKMIRGFETSIETLSGIKYIDMFPDDHDKIKSAKVNMGEPIFEADKIPTTLNPSFGIKIMRSGREYELYCVSMGNPHAVMFVDDVKDYPLMMLGLCSKETKFFRSAAILSLWSLWTAKTAISGYLSVEAGETLSCGTGICRCGSHMHKTGTHKKTA